MTKLRVLCTAALLACASSQVLADASSHAASAESFLKLMHADQGTVALYGQVQQMFNQRFEQLQAPATKKATLETYTAKANAALDKAVGWDKLKPDLVKLYVSNFSETELKDMIAFYQSPTGKKMMEKMPQLGNEAARLTQAKLEPAVPVVNKLLEDMTGELSPKQAAEPAKKAAEPAKKP
ncbi:DUF2059 domain-containing protein [Pseudomonas sp. RIT-PI-AD]|uniref:DUF2059 domain-containing protein n=1 Tax=Pseudomonas sp. RIT-PI-AD TaxID=3035294 RepID=UPI0021D9BAE8|nr:DUF2059 domain-containing protein [Pseudomonas sp. RIT-PI-AD]